MTTLTIKIPDSETQEVLTYIAQKGGKVVEKVPAAALKKAQKASLEGGLKEGVLISRGEIAGRRSSGFIQL